jgi:glucose-6-phosphate isomerase
VGQFPITPKKQETNLTEQQIENYQKQYFEIIVQGQKINPLRPLNTETKKKKK